MGREHLEKTKDSIYYLEDQSISVNDFCSPGLILDIGGGGEGIIGQLKGTQVISIDLYREELEEAPDGPLKIVMDAEATSFLDHSFEVITSFCTLMYIEPTKQELVLEEIYRVLKPGGRFLVWDVILSKCPDESKEAIAFYLNVNLPGKKIRTGYGTRCPHKCLDISWYKNIAEQVGFVVSRKEVTQRLFFLELLKS